MLRTSIHNRFMQIAKSCQWESYVLNRINRKGNDQQFTLKRSWCAQA